MTKIKEELSYTEIIDAVCEQIDLKVPYINEALENDIEDSKSLREVSV